MKNLNRYRKSLMCGFSYFSSVMIVACLLGYGGYVMANSHAGASADGSISGACNMLPHIAKMKREFGEELSKKLVAYLNSNGLSYNAHSLNFRVELKEETKNCNCLPGRDGCMRVCYLSGAEFHMRGDVTLSNGEKLVIANRHNQGEAYVFTKMTASGVMPDGRLVGGSCSALISPYSEYQDFEITNERHRTVLQKFKFEPEIELF